MSTSSSAYRISVSTIASSITSSAARCCASRSTMVAMPTRLGLADRFAQQRVGALAALGGNEVVGRLEEAIVDLVRLDEAADVDGAGLLERGRLEVFLRQDDEAALLVLVALDQLFPRDRLALARADALELHRRLVLGVQHAEARA